MAVDQETTVFDPDLFHVNSDEQFFKTKQDLYETFQKDGYDAHVSLKEFHEYCDNTLLVAEKCENFKPNMEPKLPEVPNAREKLRQMVELGLKEKGLWDSDKKYEIDGRMVNDNNSSQVINQSGDADDIDAWGIYLKPMLPVGENFNVYALLGYGSVEVGGMDESGFQWGAGASYGMSENLSLFVDYVSLYDDTYIDSWTDRYDYVENWDYSIYSINVGLTYKF